MYIVYTLGQIVPYGLTALARERMNWTIYIYIYNKVHFPVRGPLPIILVYQHCICCILPIN